MTENLKSQAQEIGMPVEVHNTLTWALAKEKEWAKRMWWMKFKARSKENMGTQRHGNFKNQSR